MPDINSKLFKAADLRLVSPAPPPDAPALIAGDWCRLNSGGPVLLVVDAAPDADQITVSYHNGEKIRRITLVRAVVRRLVIEEMPFDGLF